MKIYLLNAMLISKTQMIVLIVLCVILFCLIVAEAIIGIMICKRKRAREIYVEKAKQAVKAEKTINKPVSKPKPKTNPQPKPKPKPEPVQDAEPELVWTPAPEAEEEDERDEEFDEEFDDDEYADTDEETEVQTVSSVLYGEVATRPFYAEILGVDDMSEAMRVKFGFVGEEYAHRKYFVRYTFGFEARLRRSDDEVKERYAAFADEIASYKGLKIKKSFKQQRVYKGRETLALIFFKGKKVCVAFALDPVLYVNSKYHGLDKSAIKKFEKTPYLIKLGSARKLGYAKELLAVLAEKFNLERGEDYRGKYELSALGRDELFDSGLMTMRVLREVDPDTDVILGVGLAPLTVTDKKVEEDTPFNLADVVTEEPTDEEIVPVEEIDEPAPGYDEEIGEETAVAEAQPAAEEIAEESEPAQEVAQAQNAIDEKPVKHSAIKPVKVVVTNEDNYRYRKRSKPRGAKREIIDTGTLNANFWDGETVDVEKLIEKGLFPATATYYKVLRGGEVTKPLIIRANDFSGEAEEAIISAGGKAVRI